MNAIAAVNQKGYIGKGGDLMYSIKEDLAYFASVTRGKTLVMGRKTLLSLPGGKGLKGRTNILLSRTISEEEAAEKNVLIARDVKGLFELLDTLSVSPEDLFVIGGGEIYALLLPYCDKLYITRILSEEIGEVRFPEIPNDFTLQEGELHQENGISYRFDLYVRVR